MIKLMLFDLDNTLYPTYEQVSACRKAAIKKMMRNGLNGNEKDLFDKLNCIVKELGSNSEKHFDTLINQVCANKNEREKEYIIGKGVTAYAKKKDSAMKLYPDTKKTLNALIHKGYKIGILTDGVPVKQFDKINRLHLDKYFLKNVWVTKDKTDGVAIKEILNFFNMNPEEVMFIGDRKKSDVLAADKYGLVSVQLLKGPYFNEHGPEPDYMIKSLTDILSLSFITQTPYINA